MTPDRNPSEDPLPGSVSNQNSEEQPGGPEDGSGRSGVSNAERRGDEQTSDGGAGEGSQSTGDPDAAG